MPDKQWAMKKIGPNQWQLVPENSKKKLKLIDIVRYVLIAFVAVAVLQTCATAEKAGSGAVTQTPAVTEQGP